MGGRASKEDLIVPNDRHPGVDKGVVKLPSSHYFLRSGSSEVVGFLTIEDRRGIAEDDDPLVDNHY